MLLLVILFTPVGYIVATTCGIEYYIDIDYKLHDMEVDGSLPRAFNIELGGSPPKRGMPIPGFLFYRLDQRKVIIANLKVPRGLDGILHIDLTKLKLQLDDGRKENLLPVSIPVRFYVGNHEFASRFRSYKSGRHRHTIENYSHQHKARFDATLWPPTETATLIAEGIVTTVSGDTEPFLQILKWHVEENKGFRKKGSH